MGIGVKGFTDVNTSDIMKFQPDARDLGNRTQNYTHAVDFLDCVKNPVNISADRGRVFLSTTFDKYSQLFPSSRLQYVTRQCKVTVSVLQAKVMTVSLKNTAMIEGSKFGVTMEVCDKKVCGILVLHMSGSDRKPPGVVYIENNTVSYTFSLNLFRGRLQHPSVDQRTSFTIEFAASSLPLPSLNLTYTSNTSGSITSPWFDGIRECPSNVKDVLTLTVPEDHVVMISFPFSRVYHFSLEIVFITSNFMEDKLVLHNDKTHGAEVTRVLNPIANLSFHFQSYADKYCGPGFHLLFSFHSTNNTPIQLNNGEFVCSTSTFKSFQQHLRCNYVIECEDSEDEKDCNYTNSHCRSGVSIGNQCFFVFSPPHEISWNEARQQCHAKGTELASFSNVTYSTLNELTKLLKIFSVVKKRIFAIGLLYDSVTLPPMYRTILKWVNGIMAWGLKYRMRLHKSRPLYNTVGYIHLKSGSIQIDVRRDVNHQFAFVLCEKKQKTNMLTDSVLFPMVLESPSKSVQGSVVCPQGHLVHDFLACDLASQCHTVDSNTHMITEPRRMTRTQESTRKNIASTGKTGECNIAPMFVCNDQRQRVPYTLVCDHGHDCLDQSDERFCHHSDCVGFSCHNKQCIPFHRVSNGIQNCLDGSDETVCTGSEKFLLGLWFIKLPFIFNMTNDGRINHSSLSVNESCPQTHFQCPRSHCLPVYLRCNGIADCPNGEDENLCEHFLCPGFYHCRGTKICLHVDHVCDGWPQCPQHDDERFCSLSTCPSPACSCQGFEFTCRRHFHATNFPDLRYINASGSNMSLEDFRGNHYLIYLNLQNCGLEHPSVAKNTLPNLQQLDLSHNALHTLNMEICFELKSLKHFSLSWNPITVIIAAASAQKSQLTSLEISGLKLDSVNPTVFSRFTAIQHLNLSHGEFTTIESFSALAALEVVDMRYSPVVYISKDVFKSLDQLTEVYVSNFKLCCRQLLPEQVLDSQCFAPTDEVSSCDNLLRSDAYRLFLWVFAALSFMGNSVSFLVRSYLQRKRTSRTAFPTFVSHLSLADFLMGVYLCVIGVADLLFQGSYLWRDMTWKFSVVCKMVGFVSLVSCEVSAFIISLITLDRFIVLHFPFSQVRFGRRFSLGACTIAWSFGVIIAAIPLTPMTSHWRFYSQTGICIPLPITRKQFPGQGYAFGVMIVLNFVVFVLIAVGQMAIFVSVRTSSKTPCRSSSSRTSDLTLAYRLAAVVVTDFLCWFPVGILGLLASNGVAIPGEVNVAMAIFVLPLNSALNPFIYTLNTILEKRKAKRLDALTRAIEVKVKAEMMAGVK